MFGNICMEAPIPPDRLEGIDPELATGRIVATDEAMSSLTLAEATVGGDGPVRFLNASLSARDLLATLVLGEESL